MADGPPHPHLGMVYDCFFSCLLSHFQEIIKHLRIIPKLSAHLSQFGASRHKRDVPGLFGRGWLPPEERGKLVIEPEAEEEANGCWACVC